MAPRKRKRSYEGHTHPEQSSGLEGIFSGMVVYLIPHGVQRRRLQIWEQKLSQMGAKIEGKLMKTVTHVFAIDTTAVKQCLDDKSVKCFNGIVLRYEWLENSLKSGEKLAEESYVMAQDSEKINESDKAWELRRSSEPTIENTSDEHMKANVLRSENNTSSNDTETCGKSNEEGQIESFCSQPSSDAESSLTRVPDASKDEIQLLYNPPNMNRNITEIFGKLISIYRALGDDRRSFSYYKAIPVIEKLPFKIESVDQVKDLPAIGKSLKDHIHEIVTTGRLSKLEHFESDEKVRTVSLFGGVWGIGPATALKLYEKGHRSLKDLENEDSLTNVQRLGLKFFNDIENKIPRDEVKEMEALLQKTGEIVLPGVVVVCAGSYRRGKANCGDLDVVITHPDGQSHRGFLPKYVRYLKEIKFLREDLVFSVHSVEETDSGVDTYFGLCTYPGRELRHRIDLKVYPREIYAFGLIAWTGNDVLNRRLRLLAESKGYRLDDTGLFLATQSSGGKRGVKSSISMNCKTEKEVFDVLGFPWLEPHERNL